MSMYKPDVLDLTLQRVEIGDQVPFVTKFTNTQAAFELFSQQCNQMIDSIAQEFADTLQTANQAAQTATDKAEQTGQDALSTAADVVLTGQDRVATGEDRQATGQDRQAAEQAASTATTKAGEAAGSAQLAGEQADRAEAAASSLPDGTINDSIVSDADTWSSAYLNRLIVDWVDITASTVLAAKTNYAAYFAAGPLTLTLPATPTANDFVQIYAADGDATGSTIARNGQTIMGLAEDLTLDYPVTLLRLVFSGTDWRIAV